MIHHDGHFMFLVPEKHTSLDAVFDEKISTLLCMSTLPFQGALKIRGNTIYIFNIDTLAEVTRPLI